MSFPTSPSNNQTAIVNGITYVYNSTNTTWTRVSIVNPANAAFIQANAAYTQANAAYNTANTNTDTISVAFNQANNAFSRANNAFTQANTAFNAANNASLIGLSAGSFANGAFAQANASYALANTNANTAQAAFNQANAAYNTANTNANTSQAAFTQANAAFVVANGAAFVANTDVTSITASAGTYGNTTIIPIITLAANGRVSAITNTAIGTNALTISNTTASTSNTTGALIVSGGLGVSTNVYATSVYANNHYFASGNSLATASIAFIIDGGGSAITTGIKGDLTIPFNCTINNWTLLSDISGNTVIDIWKTTYAGAPPVAANTITGSAPPTLSSATKNTSTVLTGWTTTIVAGDVLRFNVNSATTLTRTTLSLQVTRT